MIRADLFSEFSLVAVRILPLRREPMHEKQKVVG